MKAHNPAERLPYPETQKRAAEAAGSWLAYQTVKHDMTNQNFQIIDNPGQAIEIGGINGIAHTQRWSGTGTKPPNLPKHTLVMEDSGKPVQIGILRTTSNIPIEVVRRALPSGHVIVASRDWTQESGCIDHLIEGPDMPAAWTEGGGSVVQCRIVALKITAQQSADGSVKTIIGWMHIPDKEWFIEGPLF